MEIDKNTCNTPLNDYFLKQRGTLINFMGLILLGGFFIIFQEQNNCALKLVWDSILFFYFSSLLSLVLTKYLFMNDLRTWALDTEKARQHSDTLSVIACFVSIILFLIGTFIGLHALFGCSIYFILLILISIFVLFVGVIIEYLFQMAKKKAQG